MTSAAKSSHQYVCQACGASHPQMVGQVRCLRRVEFACGRSGYRHTKGPQAGRGKAIALADLRETAQPPQRLSTAIAEFDRVLGGGLVEGSAILLGGDPGIGKSTLLLQAASKLAKSGATVVYISGEESLAQIQLRAERLGLKNAPLQLASATNRARYPRLSRYAEERGRHGGDRFDPDHVRRFT